MTQEEMLDMVMFYVERDDLNRKGRQRETIYKKCFLMHKLREYQYSLSEIGRLFNQHHASVIHNISTHKDLSRWNTEHYETIISEYVEAFRNTEYKEPIRNIYKDIMECENIFQLRRVKRWVLEKKYGDDATYLE